LAIAKRLCSLGLLAGVYVDPMNTVLLTETQQNETKSALCNLSVIILGLNTAASSQDADSNSTTTDSEGKCDEADFDRLMYQHDCEASSKRRNLVETANTSATVRKTFFKADFFDALKQVELTDRKSKLEVQEDIKEYLEKVKESVELVATRFPKQVSVERLFSTLRLNST